MNEEHSVIVPQVGLTFDPTIMGGLVSPQSIAMYARGFRSYLDYAQTPQEAMKASTLARWRAHLANTTKYSPKTINRMLSSVRSVMEEAEVQGYVPTGTALAFKQVKDVREVAMKDRLRQHNRTKISPEEMRRIVDSPDPSTPSGLRDRALLHTWGSSGMRVTELATLTIGQLRKVEDSFQVEIKGKNDVESRQAPISQEAYQYIEQWLAARRSFSPYIFTGFAGRGADRELTTPLTSRSVERIVKKYAKLCGIAYVKPHDGRRFVGTQIAKENPRTAQKVLGHKKISTTMEGYVLDELEAGVTNKLF